MTLAEIFQPGKRRVPVGPRASLLEHAPEKAGKPGNSNGPRQKPGAKRQGGKVDKNLGIDDVVFQVALTTALHWFLGHSWSLIGHRIGFTVPIALVVLSAWRWLDVLNKKNPQSGG
jgi:hypothetical protein